MTGGNKGMEKNGIKIENESCRAYVNMRQEGEFWRFEEQDPQLHVYFKEPIHGLRLKLCLEMDGVEHLMAALYYKGAEEEFGEKRVYSFPLYLNRRMEREIYFPYPIDAIRLDLSEENGVVQITELEMRPVDSEEVQDALKENLGELIREEKTVVVTHEMSHTGAPILAYHIARELKQNGHDVVVLAGRHGDGFLEEKFEKEEIPVLYLHDSTKNVVSVVWCGPNGEIKNLEQEAYLESLMLILRESGFQRAITNTVVAGEYVHILKQYGFQIVSLIHEMKTTISLYGFLPFGAAIAHESDYIVFPDKSVQRGFEELFPAIEGTCLIRPQGVYMKSTRLEEQAVFFEEYGFSTDDTIVMCSGTGELRKGTDLFVAAASILHKSRKEVHFVWTGEFGDPVLEGWIFNQIRQSGLEGYVHFLPFIKDSKKYHGLLSHVDVFWLTSREDPFPSVVLEAMKYEIPVAAFENSGGANTMLAQNRGILIPDFDVHQLACATEELLKNKPVQMVREAREWVGTALKFSAYVDYLEILLRKETQIQPEVDLYEMIMPKPYSYFRGELSGQAIQNRIRKMQDTKPSRRTRLSAENVVLLDTAKGTARLTNQMIMEDCRAICRQAFPGKALMCVPVHQYFKNTGELKNSRKILCGTDILSPDMETSGQLLVPECLEEYADICLMGVGVKQFQDGDSISQYTRNLLGFMLQGRTLHGVRDEKTRRFLEQIGVRNVVRTGCPSVWGLTEAHCSRIPKEKGKAVFIALESRQDHRSIDRELLKMLKEEYEVVYLWVRDKENLEYLQTLDSLNAYHLLPGTTAALYEQFQTTADLDYVGTHIQAGIQSLRMGKRSLIISDTEYAQALREEMHFPILKRTMEKETEAWVCAAYETKILLPEENIRHWKSQFKRKFPIWYPKW